MIMPMYANDALPNIQLENFLTSIFKLIKEAYNSGSNKIINTLLVEMIHTLKTQNNAISELRDAMYKDKTIAVAFNTDEFYDILSDAEDSLEKLVIETKEYKDKSEIFAQLHNIVDELYTNTLQYGYQVGQMVSELKQEEQLAS